MNSMLVEYLHSKLTAKDRVIAKRLLCSNTVHVEHSRDTGRWLWVVDIGEDFWLNDFTTKAAAVKWIKQAGLMNRTIIGMRKDR